MVIIRFGHDGDDTCMQMDETLASVADKMKNFAVVYLVDITEVPDFNAMYELYDPCTVMFFFRNRVRLEAYILECKVKLPSRRQRPGSSSQHVVPSRRGQSLCDTNLPAHVDGSFEPRVRTGQCSRDLPADPYALFVCPGRTPHPRQRSHASPAQSPFQHIMVDLGTGDNNKINWAMTNKQDFIDIVETVYRGARKGRGLVTSPVDYSTKYRY